MRTDAERFLHNLATVETFLTAIARIDSDHPMTSSLSLISEDVEECTPGSVHDALGHVVVFHHVGDVQVFYGNVLIPFGVLFGHLEMEVSALAGDLEMRLCSVLRRFAFATTALLAPAHHSLLTPECPLARAIVPGILNRVPFAIGQEGRETNINANIRMGTRRGKMLRLRNGFADDERVPICLLTTSRS